MSLTLTIFLAIIATNMYCITACTNLKDVTKQFHQDTDFMQALGSCSACPYKQGMNACDWISKAKLLPQFINIENEGKLEEYRYMFCMPCDPHGNGKSIGQYREMPAYAKKQEYPAMQDASKEDDLSQYGVAQHAKKDVYSPTILKDSTLTKFDKGNTLHSMGNTKFHTCVWLATGATIVAMLNLHQ